MSITTVTCFDVDCKSDVCYVRLKHTEREQEEAPRCFFTAIKKRKNAQAQQVSN